MEIKIKGNVNGAIVEHAESGSTVIGNDNRSINLNLADEKQISTLKKELLDLKDKLVSDPNYVNISPEIDTALSAIDEKDESKLKKALKCIGRECSNIAEGVLASVIYALLTQH